MRLFVAFLFLNNAVPGASAAVSSKVYAIYFPQFHEDKLNNLLWEKGFTDWKNLNDSVKVNRYGSPIVLPTELGYYDLLDIDTRIKQAELAKAYGIDGFIYHHYWFYHMFLGPSLNGVIDKMLADGQPDVPFALNWAQESWTNTWNGKRKYQSNIWNDPVVLIEQLYPHKMSNLIDMHYLYLRNFFHHKNYILVKGCPLFFVYGASQRHEVISIRERLRQLAIDDGFPAPGLHIPAMSAMAHHVLYQNGSHHIRLNKRELSSKYNDAVQFYPYISNVQKQMKLPDECLKNVNSPWREALKKPTYVGVVTMFDNTPRRDLMSAKISNRLFYPESRGGPAKSLELDIAEAMLFEMCCQKASHREEGGKFILINAFNEWGEGMVLEPSNTYGRSLLEAVAYAKKSAAEISCNYSKLFDHRIMNSY